MSMPVMLSNIIDSQVFTSKALMLMFQILMSLPVIVGHILILIGNLQVDLTEYILDITWK